MREEQRRASSFALAHGMTMEPWVRFLDTESELGELSKAILKATDYGGRQSAPTPDMEEELGDCLFSLLCLAEALGIDGEGALEKSLQKYEKRFAATGQMGSGR